VVGGLGSVVVALITAVARFPQFLMHTSFHDVLRVVLSGCVDTVGFLMIFGV